MCIHVTNDLIKMQILFKWMWERPKLLHFLPAPTWYWDCYLADYTLCIKALYYTELCYPIQFMQWLDLFRCLTLNHLKNFLVTKIFFEEISDKRVFKHDGSIKVHIDHKYLFLGLLYISEDHLFNNYVHSLLENKAVPFVLTWFCSAYQ